MKNRVGEIEPTRGQIEMNIGKRGKLENTENSCLSGEDRIYLVTIFDK